MLQQPAEQPLLLAGEVLLQPLRGGQHRLDVSPDPAVLGTRETPAVALRSRPAPKFEATRYG